MDRADFVSVVEAGYAPADDDVVWLQGIVTAAQSTFDVGFGVAGWLYDTSGGEFRLEATTGVGAPLDVFRRFESAVVALPPKQLMRCYLSTAATTMSQQIKRGPTEVPELERHLGPIGARDILRASLADATGQGVGIGALLPAERRLGAKDRESLTRLAAHLLAGYRLRRRPASAEAVLTATGKVVDAAPPAQSKRSREALREAAVAIDAARGKLRRRDPEAALAQWRSLVEGRWSIVDHHDRDGRRYLVARENTPPVPEFAGLSPRETQVVARVAAGHALKLIASDLGVTHSTVTVHLGRALRKLGLANRYQLSEVLSPWADCWSNRRGRSS